MKFRISPKGVNDVGGMSLSSRFKMTPEFFIVSLGNSNFISRYTEAFINFTVNFQVNDARLIPILIPNSSTLFQFENLSDSAIEIKKMQLNNKLSLKDAESKLNKIQQELDLLVNTLYHLV